ncbi:nuclear transport factor 2 family protein [uncultured Tolumonas sp.]|uniref:YybH family protein n=1 Tax=uncultured Tolumonas sp. TaxID=263765 RepID=UPI002A0A97D1|nr:nuclear transport factor 2 family protein [uncultured Tolumonas sp.]
MISPHPIVELINKADLAINSEDFDTLIDIYSDDAVLVIKPGMNAVGKEQIKKAFIAIANYFEHSINVTQADLEILESNDAALVLSKTIVKAASQPEIERKATYVFKYFENQGWLCVIDNSYGHDLLESNA